MIQIGWLQAVAEAGVSLVIAYDMATLEAQIDRGILEQGLRLAQ